ncbi:MAG: TIGR04552 family protein [Oligoflexales bacterium]
MKTMIFSAHKGFAMNSHTDPHERWKKGQASKYWSFSWDSLEVLLSGRSAIDMQTLPFYDFNDATQFLENYGYHLKKEKDAKQAHAILVEAIFFIKNTLLPEEWASGCQPPQEIFECYDPRRLLLWASSHSSLLQDHRLWSCAILRVMHTIAHLDRLELHQEHAHARQQIQNRFCKYFTTKDNQTWFGQEHQKVPLKALEWKRRKSRHSILLKLLHKPSNVSETIYDHLGIRFTTHFLSDAFVILKQLLEYNLVTFASTNPTRARNTLVNIENFRKKIDDSLLLHKQGKISDARLLDQISDLTDESCGIHIQNPHSSSEYRSIQITCRQRISYPNPALSWMKKMPQSSIETPWFQFIKNWHGVSQMQDIHVFYPFEIQIQDTQAASASSENGLASHENYKQAQKETARKRVAKELLANFNPSQKRHKKR